MYPKPKSQMSTPDEALAEALRRYGHTHLEVEFRLGHARPGFGGFAAGITKAGFYSLRDSFLSTPDTWDEILPETESVEYLGHDKKFVVPPHHWQHKRRLAFFDECVDGTPWVIRTSLAVEEIEPPPTVPPKDLKYKRIKKRTSFIHRCWRIDFTRVVSNLPAEADSDSETYEVEFELHDTSEFFVRPILDILHWGRKLARDAVHAL